MWHMISAIQIVIDKHLPVAVDIVRFTREVMQLAQSERRNSFYQPAQKLGERRGMRVQIDENKLLPRVHLHRNQSIILAVEILYAFEIRHAFERAIQPVV